MSTQKTITITASEFGAWKSGCRALLPAKIGKIYLAGREVWDVSVYGKTYQVVFGHGRNRRMYVTPDTLLGVTYYEE